MGKGIVNELTTTVKNLKKLPNKKETNATLKGSTMDMEDDRRSIDNEESGDGDNLERKMVVERAIKKKKLHAAGRRMRRYEISRKQVEAATEAKKEEIKNRLKNKKSIKLDPTVLKNYNEKFETESRKVLDAGKLAAGKRKRLKKKAHYTKKKMFGQYIDKMQSGSEVKEPDFEMGAISKELKFMEINLEKEKQKFAKAASMGVASDRIDQTAVKEINHISKVMKHPSFKQDPLATIKQHLSNTYKDKKA